MSEVSLWLTLPPLIITHDKWKIPTHAVKTLEKGGSLMSDAMFHALGRKNHLTEMCRFPEAGWYFRRIVSISLRLKVLLGPATRVQTKQKLWRGVSP